MEFDIKLEHVPGTKMVISDTLSRRPDLCLDDNDNDDMTLLLDTLFVSAVDLALKDLLASAGRNDSIIREALQALKDRPHPRLAWQIGQSRMASHFTKDDVMYRTTWK